MLEKTIAERYRIVEKLGEGAMGQVWKAYDERLHRDVALKFLPEFLTSSAEARTRFVREAQAASKLDHPNLATVYDADESKGQVYICFQYIEGETVRDRLEKGQIPLQEAVRIIKGAASALAVAHEEGILHRDVTSRNVMINAKGEGVLLDFGLALAPRVSRVTETGKLMGTMGYVAPELFKGEEPSASSDLYGLGVVFYELVTGRMPFEGDYDAALIYATARQKPKYASEIRPEVPDALDQVLEKALGKKPDRRYQNPEDLGADLDRLVTSGALEFRDERAKPTGMIRRTRRFIRHKVRIIWQKVGALPVVVRTAGAAILVLGLYLSWAFVQKTWPFLPTGLGYSAVAVIPFENLSMDRAETDYLADGIAKNLASKLRESTEIRVLPWSRTAFYSPGEPIEETFAELHVDAILFGSFRLSEDQIETSVALFDGSSNSRIWKRDFAAPLDALLDLQTDIVVEAAMKLKGRLEENELAAIQKPPTTRLEAYEKNLQAAALVFEDNPEVEEEALRLFEEAIEIDSEFAEPYVGIGAILTRRYWLGQEGGDQNLETAKEHYRRALRLNPKLHAARRGLIRVYWQLHLDEECLKLAQSIPTNSPDDPEALALRAESYITGALPKKAISLNLRILELQPENEGALWGLVAAYSWAGMLEKVIEFGELFLNEVGEDFDIHLQMGRANVQLGNYGIAENHFQNAIELGGENPQLGVFTATGNLYEILGDEANARAVRMRGLELLTTKLERNSDNSFLRVSRAYALAELGYVDEFKEEESELLTKAAAMDFPALWNGLAFAYLSMGDADRAADYFELSLDHGSMRWLLYLGRSRWASFVSGDELDFPKLKRVHRRAEELRARWAEIY